MFKLKRVEQGEENKFTITVGDDYISIAGAGEFVARMVKDLCQNSEEFEAILRENLQGLTHEDVAREMRRAGFDEDIVRDFEDDNFWDDVIFEK